MNRRSWWAMLLGMGIVFGSAFSAKSARADDVSPRITLSRVFEVEAKWPRRPTGFHWGAVPGITVDAKDEIYVFTRAQPPVQVYDKQGKYLRGWGAEIGRAHHIKAFHGFIWITDIGHHVVQKYTRDGKLLLTIGTKGRAGCDQNTLNKPTDVTVLPSGDVYISDGYGNSRVVHYDKTGKFINEWGKIGSAPGEFDIPHAIAHDSKGRIYVADRNNARIQIFDGKGQFIEQWRDLMIPWGFHVTKSDEIWVCGSSPMRWRKEDQGLGCPPKDQICLKLTPQGRLLQLVTIPKAIDGLEQPGELNWVHCIAFDSAGNMYLGDIVGRRAQKFRVIEPDR